jgi:hypothetical protein
MYALLLFIRRLLCKRPFYLDQISQIENNSTLVNCIIHHAFHSGTLANDAEKTYQIKLNMAAGVLRNSHPLLITWYEGLLFWTVPRDLTLGTLAGDVMDDAREKNGLNLRCLLPSSHCCTSSKMTYHRRFQHLPKICAKTALTEVNVLLPRPSWQFTTIGVFDDSVRITTSRRSMRSEKSGGPSAVMGMRLYKSSTPSPTTWRAAMTSLRTATFSDCTSSHTGITEPSDVSVCSRTLIS